MRQKQAILFILAVGMSTVFVPAGGAQVRQSYYERSSRTCDRVETFPEKQRLRLLASDRLAVKIDEAMDAGNYRDAIGYAEAQLELRKLVLGDYHPETISPLIAHGFACWRQSRFAEGEKSLKAARDLISANLGRSHPEMARCLDLLGLCRMAQGYHEEAKQLYFEALTIALDNFGELHEMTIACYDDLGAVHQEQSRLAESEPFRRKALALSRRLNGPEHRTTARLTHNLGKLVARFGDYGNAETLFREALDTRTRLLGTEHPDVAASMDFLGSVLTLQRRLDEAEPYLRRALEIRRNTLGEDHDLTAMSIGRLAHVCAVRGELDGCLRYLQEELAVRRRVHGNEHPDVVRCLRSIAGVYIRMGEYDLAERYIGEAVALVDKPALETFTGWFLDSYLGRIAMLRGDYERAEEIFDGITGAFETARSREVDHDRLATYKSGGNPYVNLAGLRLLNGRRDLAWPAMERYLGRGLFELLVAFGDSPLSPAETAREDSLDSVLLGLEQQLAVLRESENKNGRSPDLTKRIETTRTRLLETQSARYAFREYVGGKYPAARGEVYSLDRVQAALDGNTAVVGWLDVTIAAGRRAAWVYVVTSRGPVVWKRLPDNDEDGFDDLPGLFRDALCGAASWPYRITETGRINWTARRLFRQRLKPVEETLAGIDNLVVIPAGAMEGVPVEALIDGTGQYAGDRFTISYASSATVFTWLNERASATHPPSNRSLIVGAPLPTRPPHATQQPFAALPAGRREIESVASCLPGAIVLSGADASEQELVALAAGLDRFDTIHLATHASIDTERPGQSYLLLSQNDLPDPLECAMAGSRIYDGRLTAREIVREWNLDADLVTLSACRTALGRRAAGEGYVGFAHAFLQSGAKSVVVSLWEVDDKASSLLMDRFYRNLSAGEGTFSRAKALGDAKSWLREYKDETGECPFRHPAYWSAFILVGRSG